MSGVKIPVAAFLDPGLAALAAGMRPEAVGRRAGSLPSAPLPPANGRDAYG